MNYREKKEKEKKKSKEKSFKEKSQELRSKKEVKGFKGGINNNFKKF